ncbi:zinc finger, CCHC-type containing protein, partial [Tanacetum coccineum]
MYLHRNEDQVSGSGADEHDNADVMMTMSAKELLDWIMDLGGAYHITYKRDYLFDLEEYDGGNILLGNGRECHIRGDMRNLISLGTLEKEGFTVKMQSGKIKVIKGSLVVLSGTRRANYVYTLDGQAVTRKTLKGRKQLGEYQIGWKIKTGNVLDFCNQRSTQQCTKSGVAKHLGVAGLQQQNGLVKETNVTLLALIQSGLSKVLWAEDTTISTYLVKKNMGFNESAEYKKTFIGSGVGTGSMQVLQEVEFDVELQEDHAFKVEPQENFDHVVEDSNEAAFAVVAVNKIYAHESLTFNDTVACEVISKWKAGLKDDMDARSDVYVLSNGYRNAVTTAAEIWVTKGLLDKAKGNILGMEIVKDQSCNTPKM